MIPLNIITIKCCSLELFEAIGLILGEHCNVFSAGIFPGGGKPLGLGLVGLSLFSGITTLIITHAISHISANLDKVAEETWMD